VFGLDSWKCYQFWWI